jgi:hypothetical protein
LDSSPFRRDEDYRCALSGVALFHFRTRDLPTELCAALCLVARLTYVSSLKHWRILHAEWRILHIGSPGEHLY